MNQDQLIRRLMVTFQEELDEHIRVLNAKLLALEQNPPAGERATHLMELFRAVHSLKGAARAVNVGTIAEACHVLEEILTQVRDGLMSMDESIFSLFFAAADALEEAAMRLREQKDLTESPLVALVTRLRAEASGQPAKPPAGHLPVRTAPPSQPSGDEPRPGDSRIEPLPVSEERMASVASGTATVRIAAERLDALLGQSSELLVSRRRILTRLEDVADLLQKVGRWRAEWRAVDGVVGRLAHGGQAAGRLAHRESVDGLPNRVVQILRGQGAALSQLEKDVERLAKALAADAHAVDQAAQILESEVQRVRMFPFPEACQGLDRLVRDLALAGRKEVDLVIDGNVSLDRSVLEGLRDPLRHLVRNAVDHGVELPEERERAGKRRRATITVSAAPRGAGVEVVVADNGRGLNLEMLRRRATERGLPETANERELAQAIFLPGVSTAPIVTEVSGRGVGLDAVKTRVEELHGYIDVSFTTGQGTRFTLTVPLTLTSMRALLIKAGGQPFAIVGTNIRKLARISPTDVRTVTNRRVVTLDDELLPVISLAAILGLPVPENRPSNDSVLVAVVASGESRTAFLVDELVAEQEVIVKSLGPRIRKVRHVYGATVLASGQVALVLNAADLVRSAQLDRSVRPTSARAREKKKKVVLLVEDSVTTRALERSILETSGYEVLTAADGEAAWKLLQERGADLLVSDVEMPLMDGFALTETVRASARFRELPVVLVTSRETDHDRARGIEVGANAYLSKSAFDQKHLLETLAQLI